MPKYLVAILALMMPACAPKGPAPVWTGETRLAATYQARGASLPLTLVLLRAENSGAARLVLISAFGATLGDCLLENGRARCRAPRATAGLAREIAEALARELKNDGRFLSRAGTIPASIQSKGWSLDNMTVTKWPEK